MFLNLLKYPLIADETHNTVARISDTKIPATIIPTQAVQRDISIRNHVGRAGKSCREFIRFPFGIIYMLFAQRFFRF